MMSKYLQVIWLYIIGLTIIFVGVYLLMLESGPASFIVMLVGLGVAAIGAAHGRKMRVMGQLDIEKLMQEGGLDGTQSLESDKKQAEAEAAEAEKLAAAQAAEGGPGTEPAPVQPAEEGGEALPERRGGLMGMFRRSAQQGELTPQDVMEIEMEDIKSGKLAPTEADIIELVCPKCGSENEEKNYFCFSCGNKLRKKPTTEAGKEKEKIAVEPGAIKIVGDKRVAKVVICIKCNAANKEKDKFCFSCGKKLKAEKAKNNDKNAEKPNPKKK